MSLLDLLALRLGHLWLLLLFDLQSLWRAQFLSQGSLGRFFGGRVGSLYLAGKIDNFNLFHTGFELPLLKFIVELYLLWNNGSVNPKLLDIVWLVIRVVIYCVWLQCPLVLLILVEVIPLRSWIMAMLLQKMVVVPEGLIIHLLVNLDRLGLLLHRVLNGIQARWYDPLLPCQVLVKAIVVINRICIFHICASIFLFILVDLLIHFLIKLYKIWPMIIFTHLCGTWCKGIDFANESSFVLRLFDIGLCEAHSEAFLTAEF